MMSKILKKRRDYQKTKKNKKHKNAFFRVTLLRRCKHFPQYDIPLITVTNETKF
jgi:hypothetical protein